MSNENETSDINDAEVDSVVEPQQRSLNKSLAVVKNREANHNDVVVEMKQAERARLELLADDIRPVMLEIDETDQRFEFALTNGDRPRLWIDMTSFVCMGQDKRTYRFLKDTVMGRMVLAETGDKEKVADIVSEYVAEKVLERQRMMEGDWISIKVPPQDTVDESLVEAPEPVPTPQKGWGGFLWFLIGTVCTLAILVGAAFLLVPDAF